MASPATRAAYVVSSARSRSSSGNGESAMVQTPGSRTANVTIPVVIRTGDARADRSTATAAAVWTTSRTRLVAVVVSDGMPQGFAAPAQMSPSISGPSTTWKSRTIQATAISAGTAHRTAPVILAPRVSVTR